MAAIGFAFWVPNCGFLDRIEGRLLVGRHSTELMVYLSKLLV